jgi:hypothetical protein
MKIEKANKRDRKRNKRKNGMRVDGRPTPIQNAINNRADKANQTEKV